MIVNVYLLKKIVFHIIASIHDYYYFNIMVPNYILYEKIPTLNIL